MARRGEAQNVPWLADPLIRSGCHGAATLAGVSDGTFTSNWGCPMLHRPLRGLPSPGRALGRFLDRGPFCAGGRRTYPLSGVALCLVCLPAPPRISSSPPALAATPFPQEKRRTAFT